MIKDTKIFELAEQLADIAFGDNGHIYYSERQELALEFKKKLKGFLNSENELSVSDDQKKHGALHDVRIRNASDHSDEASQTSGELPLRSRTDDGNVCENCGKYKPEYCEY